MLLEKSKKILRNLPSLNMTIIVKDILIFPTEDTQKHNTWSWKSADTAKTALNFLKNNSEY